MVAVKITLVLIVLFAGFAFGYRKSKNYIPTGNEEDFSSEEPKKEDFE